MLEFLKNNSLKEQSVVKENKESFEIFKNVQEYSI
jgi:hypothetical protein